MTDNTEKARLGRQAEQVKPVLDAAFDAVLEREMKALINTPPGAESSILGTHAVIVAIDKAKQMVTQMISNGKLAQSALNSASRIGE